MTVYSLMKSSLAITPIEAMKALEPYCDEFLYTDVDHEWIREEMIKVIRELPRWRTITGEMRMKIIRCNFTNKELIANVHGY